MGKYHSQTGGQAAGEGQAEGEAVRSGTLANVNTEAMIAIAVTVTVQWMRDCGAAIPFGWLRYSSI